MVNYQIIKKQGSNEFFERFHFQIIKDNGIIEEESNGYYSKDSCEFVATLRVGYMNGKLERINEEASISL
jgi:uncharacterized protein YegP (UPF0339 family)